MGQGEDLKDPDTSSLYQLWKLFASPEDRDEMSHRFRTGGLGYGEVKKDLYARILEHFAGARERRAEFAAHPDTVEDILRDGVARARETAGAVVAQARAAAGLGSPSR